MSASALGARRRCEPERDDAVDMVPRSSGRDRLHHRAGHTCRLIPPAGITGSIPPGLANHVATVAMFGKPSNGCLNWIDDHEPSITVGHLYSAETIECAFPRTGLLARRQQRRRARSLEVGWVGGWRGDAVAFRFQSPPTEPVMWNST